MLTEVESVAAVTAPPPIVVLAYDFPTLSVLLSMFELVDGIAFNVWYDLFWNTFPSLIREEF